MAFVAPLGLGVWASLVDWMAGQPSLGRPNIKISRLAHSLLVHIRLLEFNLCALVVATHSW
jgi:hypothetical protein